MMPETELPETVRQDLGVIGSVEAIHGYYRAPIPDPRDAAASRISEWVIEAPPALGKELTAGIGRPTRAALLIYAERMAALSVRLGSEGPLVQGMAALMIASARYDFRDVLMSLAVVKDAAKRIGVDLGPTFARLAHLADQQTRQMMEDCIGRADWPDLEKMGRKASHDQDGFRYYSTLMDEFLRPQPPRNR